MVVFLQTKRYKDGKREFDFIHARTISMRTPAHLVFRAKIQGYHLCWTRLVATQSNNAFVSFQSEAA